MAAAKPSILLISDDAATRRELAVKLEFLGESPACAESGDWRGAAANRSGIEVVLLGNCFCDERELLQGIGSHFPRAAMVLLAAGEIPEIACAGLRARLSAAPDAPANYRNLLDTLHKARLCHEYLAGTANADVSRGLAAVQGLIGASPAIQRIREIVTRLADSEVNVLITG